MLVNKAPAYSSDQSARRSKLLLSSNLQTLFILFKGGQKGFCPFNFPFVILHGSTFVSFNTLPLTSTRRVRSPIELCAVHSLRSTLEINLCSIIILFENNRYCRELNPGPLVKKQESYPLCYAPPSPQLFARAGRRTQYLVARNFSFHF